MTERSHAAMELTLDGMAAQHAAQEAEMHRRPFTAWLDLFTEAEQLALVETVAQSPVLGLWYDRARGAGEVDLGDDKHAAFLAALVSAGTLENVRVPAVIAGEAPPS